MLSAWSSLSVSAHELCLHRTLKSGQTFRWKPVQVSGEVHTHWIGVLSSVPVVLKQTDEQLFYRVLPLETDPKRDDQSTVESEFDAQVGRQLRDYLRLNDSLGDLAASWAAADARLGEAVTKLKGLRCLRQEPLECLFSFLCSSNNNIARITKMLDSLCSTRGTHLATYHGSHLYSFPTLDSLCLITEQELRDMGFGYRAKFVTGSAKLLKEKGGDEWLLNLRTRERAVVRDSLVEFPGVGRKVADCVALFSLDKLDCIPVDTHVWDISVRNYLPRLKGQSLTNKNYDAIGDFFRDLHGPYCGWAHSFLFANELPEFSKAKVEGSAGETNEPGSKPQPKTPERQKSLKEKPKQEETLKDDNQELQEDSTMEVSPPKRKSPRRPKTPK